MKIDPNASILTLDVKLMGKTGFCFINAALDSGSTYTIIPWKVAEKLGYDPASAKQRIPITTASGTEIIPLITIDAIEFLGQKKENVKVGCHDLPPQAAVSALLGLNLLRGFCVEIDLKKGSLEIKDP
ncbi:MAG: retropepsin-like aspartic protease [Methanocellales archaeon]|nr:retropepsin-like aspartic protease [Methanocellales archaeon]MDI6903351.1 retropepsin-like aspartic protease [Methanocellales archaeon]